MQEKLKDIIIHTPGQDILDFLDFVLIKYHGYFKTVYFFVAEYFRNFSLIVKTLSASLLHPLEESNHFQQLPLYNATICKPILQLQNIFGLKYFLMGEQSVKVISSYFYARKQAQPKLSLNWHLTNSFDKL